MFRKCLIDATAVTGLILTICCILFVENSNAQAILCSSGLCQNGGTCVNLTDTYKCNCTTGFNGTNCENAANIPNNCTISSVTTSSLRLSWPPAPSAYLYRVSNGGNVYSTSSTSFSIGGLDSGWRYTFILWVVVRGQTVDLTTNTITCGSTSTLPYTPIISQLSSTQFSIRVSWQRGITRVINSTTVYYRCASNSAYTPWFLYDSTNTTLDVTGLNPGTNCYLFVSIASFDRTVNSTTWATYTVPFQNGTCSISALASNVISLHWAPVLGGIYYIVTYPGGRYYVYGARSAAIADLVAGRRYNFTLQTVGNGGSSEEGTCTDTTAPESPRNLTTYNVTQTSFKLTWSKGSTERVDSTTVYYCVTLSQTSCDSEMSRISVGQSASVTVSNLTSGRAYSVYVEICSFDKCSRSYSLIQYIGMTPGTESTTNLAIENAVRIFNSCDSLQQAVITMSIVACFFLVLLVLGAVYHCKTRRLLDTRKDSTPTDVGHQQLQPVQTAVAAQHGDRYSDLPPATITAASTAPAAGATAVYENGYQPILRTGRESTGSRIYDRIQLQTMLHDMGQHGYANLPPNGNMR